VVREEFLWTSLELFYFPNASFKARVGISMLKYAVTSRLLSLISVQALLCHLHIAEPKEGIFLMNINDHESIFF